MKRKVKGHHLWGHTQKNKLMGAEEEILIFYHQSPEPEVIKKELFR